MACICVGGGGGCTPNGSVQDYLSGFGYSYDPSDPLASVYSQVISQNAPVATNSSHYAPWAALAEACLRARALLYCTSSPGDCGTTPATVGSELAQVGQISSAGISAGSELASTLGIAGGSALALSTLGAGVVLSAVLDIFQHHAQAEAAQANALCSLCPQFSAAIRQIDAAVANGILPPGAAQQYVSQLVAGFKSADASLTKSCNAFCGYNAIAQCFVDISPFYFPQLTVTPLALPPPAVSASAPVQSAPATVVPVATHIIGSTTDPFSAPIVGAQAAAPASTDFFSTIPVWAWVVLGALVVALLFMGDSQPTVIIERR